MKKGIKVVLLQLPFPLFNHSACELFSSIPLAAGYLKAIANSLGRLANAEIEILDFALNEFCGDAMLIETLVSKIPDAVGFSLYAWNLNRSLYIIQEIKSRLPEVVTLIGGPAVTAQHNHLDKAPVDIAVYGEGENAFAQILSNMLYGVPALGRIGNICWRHDGLTQVNGPAGLPDKLDSLPSPYLGRCIDPAVYKRIWIETMRWCGYRCKYCLYPRRSHRKNPFYSTQRIRAEVALARERGVKVVDLHDSAFNLSPRFIEICRAVAGLNKDRALRLKAFLRPELITPETVRWLRASNVVNTEVGLQSTNPVALKNIGRQNDLAKFVRGVNLLKDAGIDVLVDIMVGLPGDTPKTIRETLGFLARQKFDSHSAFTILSVSPCTELWQERSSLGLKVQKEPPYYVLSTPTLGFDDIRKAIALCTQETNARLNHSILNPSNNSWFPFLYTYSQARYPGRQRRQAPVGEAGERAVTQILLDIDQSEQDIDRLRLAAERIKARLANVVTVWLGFTASRRNIELTKAFLRVISAANPYTIWHILLEPEGVLSAADIFEIENSVAYRLNHWDYLNVFNRKRNTEEYCRQATRMVLLLRRPEKMAAAGITLFYSALLTARYGASRRDLERLFELDCDGYLIDFEPEADAATILKAMEELRKRKGGRMVRFKNRWLQVLWDRHYDDTSVCSAGAMDLCVFYDRYLRQRWCAFTKEDTALDQLEWRSCCGSAVI